MSSASLRLTNGGDAQVSVLPTERGTHNVSVTSPESGQIDWSSVEAMEPVRPRSRVSANVRMGVAAGIAVLTVGVGAAVINNADGNGSGDGYAAFFVGVPALSLAAGLVAAAVPLYISSAYRMRETRRLVEGARAHHVQAAASAPAPTVVVEQPAAPMIDGANEGDEPSSAPPAGLEGP